MLGYCVGVLFLLGLTQADVPSTVKIQPIYIEDAQKASGSRITSGWDAAEGQFPYQASIRSVSAFGAVFSCGGSLIHHHWVITAGHCVATPRSLVSFVVRFGVTNLTRPALILETTRRHFHYNYMEFNPFVQTDDIALLGLDTPVDYGTLVQPVRLQSSSQRNVDYTGVTLIASGFGQTDDGSASEVLRWVYQRGISNDLCREWYEDHESNLIQDQTICSQYYNVTSQATCHGDSGGPLVVVDDDDQLTMVGITSFASSRGCASEYPSGFVRPGHYHDWIIEITGIDFDWTFD